MPHVIVEYSANIEAEVLPEDLLEDIHRAEQRDVPEGYIRLGVSGFTRITECAGAQQFKHARVLEALAEIDDAVAHDCAITGAAVRHERCELQCAIPCLDASD